MADSESYNIPALHIVHSREVERLRHQVQLSWHKEVEVLERLGLRDDLSVLDLGCGPGFVASEIMLSFPGTKLSCLDSHPGLLKQAENYLREFGFEDAEFHHGEAHKTGLTSQSFDLILARFAFQHFKNPKAVVNECYRLLKPGGMLVIIDVDDEFGFITEPPLVELNSMSNAITRAQARGGGNRLIGRHLYGLLQASAFDRLELDSIIVHSNEAGLELFRHQLDFERYTPLMHHGFITPSQMEHARQALERFMARDDAMVMASYIICAGCRPVR